MKRQYLTFDCYGTLIDWKTGIEAALRRAVGETGLAGKELLVAYVEAEKRQESGYKKYREVLRDTVASMSGVLGKEVDAEAADAFSHSVPDWPVFPDTVKFLREMGDMGYRRYILSNVDNDLLAETVKRHRLEVDGYVTAEEIGSYKPRPGHWKQFMARTGARQGESLHVAQSLFHDIIPTQTLGLDAAWVNRYDERLPSGTTPLMMADSLESLAPLLAR